MAKPGASVFKGEVLRYLGSIVPRSPPDGARTTYDEVADQLERLAGRA